MTETVKFELRRRPVDVDRLIQDLRALAAELTTYPDLMGIASGQCMQQARYLEDIRGVIRLRREGVQYVVPPYGSPIGPKLERDDWAERMHAEPEEVDARFPQPPADPQADLDPDCCQ